MNRAFTLIEVIFVIVIIGVLASMAIPKFSHLSDHSKISAELATASTIQSAIDDVHSDWVTSEGSFKWGNNQDENNVTAEGYPKRLGDCSSDGFKWILKNAATVDAKWECTDNNDGTFTYKGPASKDDSGVTSAGAGKPDSSKHWDYNSTNGTFSLKDD